MASARSTSLTDEAMSVSYATKEFNTIEMIQPKIKELSEFIVGLNNEIQARKKITKELKNGNTALVVELTASLDMCFTGISEEELNLLRIAYQMQLSQLILFTSTTACSKDVIIFNDSASKFKELNNLVKKTCEKYIDLPILWKNLNSIDLKPTVDSEKNTSNCLLVNAKN